MRERRLIPFLGMNSQPLDSQSVDGMCEVIHNLRPYGPKERPFWKPVPNRDTLDMSFSQIEMTVSFFTDGTHYIIISGVDLTFLFQGSSIVVSGSDENDGTYTITDVSYSSGDERTEITVAEAVTTDTPNENIILTTSFAGAITLKNAAWYERDRIGALQNPLVYGYDQLKRLVVHFRDTAKDYICLMAYSDTLSKWQIVKELLSSTTAIESELMQIGNYFLILTGEAETAFYHLIDDTIGFYAWPTSTPTITFNPRAVTVSTTDLESGNTKGFRQDATKYFGVIFAYKTKNGKYVRHSQPKFLNVPYDDYSTLDFYQWGFTPADIEAQLGTITKQVISGLVACITVPHKNITDAANDSVYYEVISWGVDDAPIEKWTDFREDNIPLNPVLDVDAFTRHLIAPKSIARFRNRVVFGGQQTNFQVPRKYENNPLLFVAVPPTVADTAAGEVIEEVIIKTDEGEYRRSTAVTYKIEDDTPDNLILPWYMSYPDARATAINIWYKNGTDYELAATRQLIRHPGLNIAYWFDSEVAEDFSYLQYAVGSSATTVTVASKDAEILINNQVVYNEYHKVRVSDSDLYYLPLDQTYELESNNVKDKILAVIQNTEEVSQGQFGQFPLYAFTNNSIFGFQLGSGDILFERIVPVNNSIGLQNKRAWCYGPDTLIFASNNGLHMMAGVSIQNIDDALRQRDPNYSSWIGDDATPKQLALAYNHKNRELVVSDQFSATYTESGSYIFNLEYRAWFRAFNQYKGFLRDQNNLFGFKHHGAGQVETAIDYIDKEDIATEVTVFLRTRPLILGDSRTYKRWFEGFVRGHFYKDLVGEEYEANLFFKLLGRRTGFESAPDLLYNAAVGDVASFYDWYIKTKYGSMQQYILQINGVLLPTSEIDAIECEFEYRHTDKIRKGAI